MSLMSDIGAAIKLKFDKNAVAMTKAQFNSLAEERKANRGGSGFDEMGKHLNNGTSIININDGMFVVYNSANANTLYLGSDSTGIGISKTLNPIININGVKQNIGYLNNSNISNKISLPTAPNIYPYDTVLTTEQINSGVIKHADSSNSGLIVNGKFDTDTSGWSVFKTSTLSSVAGQLNVNSTGIVDDQVFSSFQVVSGKKYIIELTKVQGSNVRVAVGNSTSNYNGEQYLGADNLANGSYIFEFTANVSSIVYLKIKINNSIGIFDNIAVFPADAISRSDLVFPESWHEDIAEKGFGYPFGNTMYLGGNTDGLTGIANGSFSGFETYSLFGNWQTPSSLIGKGYVWSSLTEAQKKAFIANPDNNCYLDGDKTIQVRYRVRVVQGWGDDWGFGADISRSYIAPDYGRMCYKDINNSIKIKGKLVSSLDLSNGRSAPEYSSSRAIAYNNGGLYISCTLTGIPDTSSAVAYEGKCFALPIALVHRRNQGGYNATYNPNGTKTMTMTPTSISDCFNPANYNDSTGYIGTSTSRPDGLFYDQVSVEDFKPSNKGADLRNSSKKRTAQSIIEEFAPKVIANTIPYYNNDTTALTTYKDFIDVRDTSGNRYFPKNKIGNVVTIQQSVANKKGFSVVTQNGKQYLQVADDATNDDTVQLNSSVVKYDIGVFDGI